MHDGEHISLSTNTIIFLLAEKDILKTNNGSVSLKLTVASEVIYQHPINCVVSIQARNFQVQVTELVLCV
jgi:hypothetical protein